MNPITQAVIEAIDASPLNRGLKGVEWVAQPGNIAIVDGDDIVLFDYEGPGLYEIHVLFETSRGRAAIDAIKSALDQMFNIHDADAVFGMIPDDRRDVKIMARWVGMRSCGKRATANGSCELFLCRKETTQ